MDPDDQIYIRLQKHLDDQAVGFPATRSGVEIKILKHIFTPQEAEIVSYLNYKPQPLQTIFGRVEHLVETPAELEKLLDRIQKKGGIESKIKNGLTHYCCAPLVVGMYEFQLGRLTPEFLKDFNEYTSNKKFGIEFLSTELPQMRTIPVSKSIHPQHNVSTFDEVTSLLQQAEEPFAIIECICRKKKEMEGHACNVTDRKETCLAIGSVARMVLQGGNGREIARDEALTILEENQKKGLVLQPSNTEKVDFICSCCGCCCGMLAVHKVLPRPLDFWASNFLAKVAADKCDACGACENRCQVGAVAVSEEKQYALMAPERCLGCGVCVTTCPTDAITLSKKPTEVRPPRTREDLYDIIMNKKKNRLEKIKLTGKLVVDAIRTGKTNSFKS
ncbi:MAG: 4Fe-4S dicluster domain-containing protein [Desulfobacterales bacterium]